MQWYDLQCLNYANEARRDLFNTTTNQDGRNVATSTPFHHRRNSGHDTSSPLSPKNSGYEAFPAMSPRNSGHDSFHVMSPKSANSFPSDFSSPANTPQSGHRLVLKQSSSVALEATGKINGFSSENVS